MNTLITLPVTSAWLVQVLLLSLRLGAALAVTPLLAGAAVPRVVRVLLVVGLSAALREALPMPVVPDALIEHAGTLVVAAAGELSLGLALGLGVQLAFGAFTFAGRLLDVQIGFSLVQVFNPLSSARGAVIATALDQLGVLLFLLLDAHHVLLRGLAWSIDRYPIGSAWPLAVAVGPLLKQVSAMFTLGFAIAAPVLFVLLLVELALAVLAQSLPQMNMLVIGFPVKILVAAAALAAWAPQMSGTFVRVYQSIYTTWNEILGSVDAAGAGRIA